MFHNELTIEVVENKSKDSSPKSDNLSTARTSVSMALNALDNAMQDNNKKCAICLSVPFIPIRAINSPPDSPNYELGQFLSWINSRLGNGRPPIAIPGNPSLSTENLSLHYEVNKALIKEVDAFLSQKKLSRQDVLDYFQISPSLYNHLEKMRFSTKFTRLKSWLAKHPKIIIAFGGIIAVGFGVIYFLSLQNDICKGSLELNKDIYDRLLKTFEEIRAGFSHYSYSPMCSFLKHDDFRLASFFSDCAKLSTEEYQIKSTPPGYASVSVTVYKHAPFDQGPDPFSFVAKNSLIAGAMGLVSGVCAKKTLSYYSRTRTNDRANDGINKFLSILTFLIMIGVLLIGLDALTDCIGLFDFSRTLAATRFSCAKACNDGFFRDVTYQNKSYEFLTPEVIPACDNSVLDRISMGASMLVTPVTFFGSRALSCLKKYRPQSQPQGQKEFEDLKLKDFIYRNPVTPATTPISLSSPRAS